MRHVWAVQQTDVDPSRPDATPYERVIVQPATPPAAATKMPGAEMFTENVFPRSPSPPGLKEGLQAGPCGLSA